MKHALLETRGIWFAVFVTVLIAIGGLVEIVPLYQVQAAVEPIADVKPYTPLELEGRDIYIREGCYNCHSQQIRPFRDETERYGPYSRAGEFIYDRPFQWGSKRTGPDLARLGGKYPDSWHYYHMRNPRDVVPESIMPNYPWLYTQKTSFSQTKRKLEVHRQLGAPYTDDDINKWEDSVKRQTRQIVGVLKAGQVTDVQDDSEIIALIAYLQKLGHAVNEETP